MRTVQGKPTWIGHSAECPTCKSLTLVTGPPTEIKCGNCDTTYKVTWYRYGDPIISTKQTS